MKYSLFQILILAVEWMLAQGHEGKVGSVLDMDQNVMDWYRQQPLISY